MKAFCDFCKCSDCLNGSKYISHVETSDNKWICDVCYIYDLCMAVPLSQRDPNGPCKDTNCKHRPKLISEWINFKQNI